MLTAELVTNYAQQKFLRVTKYALDYFDDHGQESDAYIRDLLRLDSIIRFLANDNTTYTYQDLECLYQAVQAICDPDMPLEFMPFDFPPIPTNPGNGGGGNGGNPGDYSLYRGRWYPDAEVKPNTLWLYAGQLFASRRIDTFIASDPPPMRGNTDWEHTGLAIPGEIEIVHLSEAVRDYIESQNGSGGQDTLQPTEYIYSDGTNTFETMNVPGRVIRVEMQSRNPSKFIPNSILIPGVDYTNEGGTRIFQIVREGYVPDEDDFVAVLYRTALDADVITLTTPEWDWLPDGNVVNWDFQNKYVSNRVVPNRLTSDVYIIGMNARNGGTYRVQVHQGAAGDKDVWFSYLGSSFPLPITKEPNALTVLEGWRNNTGQILWSQKLTAIVT